MKTVLFGLSVGVLIISFLVGGYFFWRNKPLGFGKFPAIINHFPMTEGPQYQKRDDVYTAFYGSQSKGFLYSVKKMPSADEAAANVRRQREALIANQSGAYSRPFVPDKADDEKSGVLAYTQGELSNIVWAEGSQNIFIFGSDAYTVGQAAAVLRGQPSDQSISLYDLSRDIPVWIKHWFGVLVPAIFAVIALLVMLSTFLFGKQKKTVIV